jgi:hypothetical protein
LKQLILCSAQRPSERVPAPLRARMPQLLLSVQADDSTAAAPYIASMLRELPFKTIGDVAAHGLELHVYCPSCYSTRQPANLDGWADRCFATARFRCSGTRHTGTPCQGTGMPVIRPAELLPVGGPVTLAFLTCPRCIWEINQVQLHKPPWSRSKQPYRCPGCSGRVEWHIHRQAWRPFGASKGPQSSDVGRP